MIKLKVEFISPGYSDGRYIIKAKGFILAVLRWADKYGKLKEWADCPKTTQTGKNRRSFY